MRSEDRVPFFKRFYANKDPNLRLLGNATAHVGDCTVQLRTTSEFPIDIYANESVQAEDVRLDLEGMFGVDISPEGWGL